MIEFLMEFPLKEPINRDLGHFDSSILTVIRLDYYYGYACEMDMPIIMDMPVIMNMLTIMDMCLLWICPLLWMPVE